MASTRAVDTSVFGSRWRRFLDRPRVSGAPAALGWIALVLSVLAPAASAAPMPSGVKFALVLAFVCIGPGGAAVAHARLGDGPASTTLALALSLSASATVSVIMLWTHSWHPYAGLLGLSVATLIAAALALVTGRRSGSSTPTPLGPLTPPPGRPPVDPRQRPQAAGPPPDFGSDVPVWRRGDRGIFDEQPPRTADKPATADSGDQAGEGETAVVEPIDPAGLERQNFLRGLRESASGFGIPSAPLHPGGYAAGAADRPRQGGQDDATMVFRAVDAPVETPRGTGGMPAAGGAPPADAQLTARIPVVRTNDPDVTMIFPAVHPDAQSQMVAAPAGTTPGDSATRVINMDKAVSAFLAERDASPRRADDTVLIPAIAGEPQAESEAAVEPIGERIRTWLGTASARNVGLHLLILAIALGLWIFSMSASSTANVGDYGLLSVMHPAFYAACAVCALGFLWQLTRRPFNPVLLIGYVIVLLLIMHATVPIMVAEPEYAWTYKHVGLIEYIRQTGAVHNSSDIYQQWPTFFAFVAQLLSVSGFSVLTVAKWAPFFFDLLACLPVFAIARTLSHDRRMPYITVFVFTAINWVGQDYLSPQAFAYVLSLCLMLIMLRWLRKVPTPGRKVWPKWLGKLQHAVQEGLIDVPYTSKGTRRLAMAALYFVYAVIVASHQLSPYLIAASAVALVVLGLIRPVRIAPILLGIAVTYVLPRYQVVDSYGIFNSFNFFANASGVYGNAMDPVVPTAGATFASHMCRILGLGVWAGTALIVLASYKRLGRVSVPATLAFAPFATILVQNYGGEAIYRVFLFSSPWCAYLLSRRALAWGESTMRVLRRGSAGAQSLVQELPYLRYARVAIGVPLLVFMTLASMEGEHGQLTFDQFHPNEVTAAEYLDTHVPKGSYLLFADVNFPMNIANYGELADDEVHMDVLFEGLSGGQISITTPVGQADVDAITGYAGSLDGPAYLVISDSMVHYAHYFGYLPDGTLTDLNNAIKQSTSWRPWYGGEGVQIYEYVPAS